MRNLLSAGLKKLRPGASDKTTGGRQARILAIAAQKGGVGKTTTTVNLACTLARDFGHKVLVVDIDPQGHVGSALREVVPQSSVSLSDVLLAPKSRDLADAIVSSGIQNLDLTAPDKTLHDTESRLSTRVGREHILQASMRSVRTQYDTILLDCPPNLGNLTLNALVAADQVLIPCDMSMLAFEGVADLLSTVEVVNERLHHPLDVVGIVLTRVDARMLQMNDAIVKALRENYGDLLMHTRIPSNSAVAKAQAVGQSLFDVAPTSRGALAYRALAAEVLDRLAGRAAS